MIAQIFENLMLNALEAGSPGTRVKVNVSNTGQNTFELEIADNGPGIAPELLPDGLFAPFRTTKPNGSGIGLWQVRRLAQSLGGTIEAENAAGGGAKFVVRLPLNRSPSE